jgi:hypothetical protein
VPMDNSSVCGYFRMVFPGKVAKPGGRSGDFSHRTGDFSAVIAIVRPSRETSPAQMQQPHGNHQRTHADH